MKTVYVMERYKLKEEFENALADFRELRASAPAESQLKPEFIKVWDELEDNLNAKIRECAAPGGGIWEGVIGRCSLSQLEADAYSEWCKHPASDYRFIKAEVEDNATTWVGYSNKRRCSISYTGRMMSAYVRRYARESA